MLANHMFCVAMHEWIARSGEMRSSQCVQKTIEPSDVTTKLPCSVLEALVGNSVQQLVGAMCEQPMLFFNFFNLGDSFKSWCLDSMKLFKAFVVCKTHDVVAQGCQTYGPRAKSGPLRGWIRPAGWFCEIKTSLFAWEVYPVILQ